MAFILTCIYLQSILQRWEYIVIVAKNVESLYTTYDDKSEEFL